MGGKNVVDWRRSIDADGADVADLRRSFSACRLIGGHEVGGLGDGGAMHEWVRLIGLDLERG